MKKKVLENLDMITILMKNDRVRKFEWLDTRTWEYESAKAKEMRKELKAKGIKATDDYMRSILYN